MKRTEVMLLGLLGMAVVATGIGVVYVKYLSRKHFVELQELHAERERLAVEWGQLQLEESTLASESEVEGKARGRLGMHLPQIDEVIVIRR